MKAFKLFLKRFLIVLILFALTGCKKEDSIDIPEEKYEFDELAYQAEMEERYDYLYTFMNDYYRNNIGGYSIKDVFAVATAMIKEYYKHPTPEFRQEILDYVDNAWQRADANNSGDCFSVFTSVYHYFTCKDFYPADKQAEYEAILLRGTGYGNKPSTRNHSLLQATARYIMHEQFPNENIVAFFGDPGGDREDPTGELTVRARLKVYPLYGEYEYNSHGYLFWHITPLRAIAELSKDENLRQQAKMVTENMILSLAPAWLDGHLAIPQARVFEAISAQTEHSSATVMLWYYFGGAKPTYEQLMDSAAANVAFTIASDFIPPIMAMEISRAREESYTHYEMQYEYKGNMRYGASTFMQTFMNKDYAIFSSDMQINPIEQTETRLLGYTGLMTWGVRWRMDDITEKSTFTVRYRDITADHDYYVSVPYEQVLQNDGTVIGVFDMPDDGNHQAVIGTPNNYFAIIDQSASGTVYLHYGKIMIAFHISAPFNMDPSTFNHHTPSISKGYFVCEVVESSDFEGDTPLEQLQMFMSAVDAKFRKISYDYNSRTYVKYQALDGTVMELTFGGNVENRRGVINGVVQIDNRNDYPVQKNPWVEQNWMEKVITYTFQGRKLTYDFEKMEIRMD